MALEPLSRPQAEAAASASPSESPSTFMLPLGADFSALEELGYGELHELAYEMRAPAWMKTGEVGEALLYRDEIALLNQDEEAVFYPSTRLKDGSAPEIRVVRSHDPVAPWDKATALIRFRAGSKSGLTVGQTGSVKFATRVRKVRTVRESAVIQSPAGPYVLVVADDKRTLTQRPIEIGSIRYGDAAVLAGLEIGERVAVQGSFFLEAERRFAGRSAP
jgi:hypothetical protein